MRPYFDKSIDELSPFALIYKVAEARPDPSIHAHPTDPPFPPHAPCEQLHHPPRIRSCWHMGGRLHGPATTAGGLGGSLAIGQAIGPPGYRYSTSPPPIADVACGSLSASRLRIEFTTPWACSGCEPGIWGVRRARFGLSIPNGNVLRGRIEGGQGVGQWGVARAWQALRLLDKPTRAVPSSFLSVFDAQPKSAPARSRNSSSSRSRSPGTGGVWWGHELPEDLSC